MWDTNDEHGFKYNVTNMIGQINMGTEMGQFLYNLAKSPDTKRILEIGTWNGLGSTLCIQQGMKYNPNTCILDSLESNTEKCKIAQELYKHDPNVRIQNKVVTKNIPEWNIIVHDLDIPKEEESGVRQYFITDTTNMNTSLLFVPPYVNSKYNFDDVYDVILLDGGDYHTYYEFMVVKDWAKIIICDDCNSVKTKKVRQYLLDSLDWELLQESLTDRNGYTSFKRVYCKSSLV